jgi:hypothetical protein
LNESRLKHIFSENVNADFAIPSAVGGKEIEGNWYCQAVKAIQYSNVGSSGTYKQITSMHSDGSCSSTMKQFSGPLSPLNEEVRFNTS